MFSISWTVDSPIAKVDFSSLQIILVSHFLFHTLIYGMTCSVDCLLLFKLSYCTFHYTEFIGKKSLCFSGVEGKLPFGGWGVGLKLCVLEQRTGVQRTVPSYNFK